ncbi:MAG: molybdenum cofactor biosynthesis protein B [Myxococcota bacterium]
MSDAFQPLGVAIVTVSDTRTAEDDRSGDTLEERASRAGHRIVHRDWVIDDQDALRNVLVALVERSGVEVILTTGGTGVTGRDITPEVVEALCDKAIPGFGELFRWQSYEKIGTSTIQSRACAGVCRGTFIFALPGSPSACRDAWDGILLQQLDIRHKPCNFAELIPRLKER